VKGNVLVIGWFSFELMGSTAGDVIAKDVACRWLREAGLRPLVAMHEPKGSHDVPADVDPSGFDTVVFVCGPIGNGPPIAEYLERFSHARTIGLDVTLLMDPAVWQPFDCLIQRDGGGQVRPDITFAAPPSDVPLVGVILVGSQDEYPTNRHDAVEAAFAELLASRDVAAVPIDTRLDVNAGGLRTAAQVESLIARMDAVLTTRLHGAALALRRGVPPIAVDSVPGGSKLLAQMRHLGWPLAFDVADLDIVELGAALDRALQPATREEARRTAERAARHVAAVRDELLAAVVGS